MKTYMNKIDRDHHLMILIFWNYISEWLNRTSCLTPDEQKRLKTVTTHLIHTSDSLVHRMDKKYADKLIRDANHSAVSIVDNTSKRIKRNQDGRYFKTDDIFDLAEYALEGCRRCRMKDFHECEKFNILLKMNIPPATEETDGCPYKG